MADTAHDPAGLSMEELAGYEETAERAPGLVVMVGAVLAFVVSVATFALGQIGIGIAAASGGMLIFGAGLAWLSEQRRRVREAERAVLSVRPTEQAGQVGAIRLSAVRRGWSPICVRRRAASGRPDAPPAQ